MSSYRGRFAPSPTGPLHFGSLFAALVSYLDAKKNQGAWLLRIEDIDPLREIPGASRHIIETLEAHHLFWDEPICYQSKQSAHYERLLGQLEARHAVFRCPCSRKQLTANHGQHTEHCQRQCSSIEHYALKFRKTDSPYSWHDRLQGRLSLALEDDFVLKRKEGYYAYQLAVVNDDHQHNITHVVRGYDLLSSTPMQLALYSALQFSPPCFGHFPILCNKGQKLSKQNHAKAINNLDALSNLKHALSLLQLDAAASERSIPLMLKAAIEQWNPTRLFRCKKLVSPL